MSKVGRPPKYHKKLNRVVHDLALLGYIDTQIASELGINVSTLYEWRHRFLKFNEALCSGKAKADSKVARALYNRAKGFKYVEETLEDGPRGHKRTLYTKVALPDSAAAIRWLEIRQRAIWGTMKLSEEDMQTMLELIAEKQKNI